MNNPLEIGALTANLKTIELPIGLVIDEINIATEAVRLDPDKLDINLTNQGKLVARVSESSLAHYLNAQARGGLEGFRAKLADGRIFIEASVNMLVEIKAYVACTLAIQNGQKLLVELESVDVMGVGAKTLVQNMIDQINPVFDLADLPIEGEIDSVDISDGYITVNVDLHSVLSPS